jgi:serine/threonine protein kinase/tetratricopeptide (TPR) repeat protein
MHAVSYRSLADPPHRRVGAFEVERPMGEGGMGVVVRARHVVSGAAVAIKLIAPGHADHARSARRFRDEVRAAARLDHPHVVRIHDFGEHREGDAAPTPYLVMELCTGGTLDVAGCLDFVTMRSALLDILGALAHAHARDVVHRDLKPSNVLLACPTDERPGLKLIDFGLARIREGLAPGLEVAGTPRYMAPEQFAGRRSDTGPATDLYALGCIAYELATGRPPFGGDSVAELAAAHTSAPPPPVRPRFAIPMGLERWMVRLLHKDPDGRFGCAADAAHALVRLGDHCAVAPLPGSRRPNARAPTVTQSAMRERAHAASCATVDADTLDVRFDAFTSSSTANTMLAAPMATSVEVATVATLATEPPEVEDAAPPMPSFDVALPPEVDAAIRADEGTEDPLGLGLGVHALRGLPFVGRIAERERLWAALAQTRETGRGRGVVVRGSSGIGKSRLVEWLAERGAELGAARTLRATHARSRGPDDGIGAMLARDLRLSELSHPALAARLGALSGEALAAHEMHVVVEMIAPTEGAARTESAQRHEAVRRLLAAIGQARPVILWLDDAALDLEAMDLACHVLAQSEEAQAILVVVTADLDSPDVRPEARAAMDRFCASTDVDTIDLAPLPAEDHERFVRRMLRLAPAAVSQIATRTAGSPSFAIALLGAWVEAGILEHDPEGFRVRPGVGTVVPPSLADAWSERLERFLERESPASRVALELAAACGRLVRAAEWLPACARAGGDPRVLDRLIQARLARTLVIDDDDGGDDDDDGRADARDPAPADFTFEHGLLVEAVRAAAERAGRWADHGRVLASVLAERVASPERLERRGRLLLQARDPSAFAEIARAAAGAQMRGELARALELVDLARDALVAAGAEPGDERWGEVTAIRVAALVRGGAITVVAGLVGRFVEDARRYRWSHALPEALWAEGTVLGQRGDSETCRARMEEAVAAFRALGHADGTSRALRGLVHIERVTGRLDEAEAHLAEWLAHTARTHDATSAGWAHQAEAVLASARGRLDEAAACADWALSAMESAANLFGIAHCLNTAAEIARRRGAHEIASRHYERSLTLSTSLGLQIRHVVRLNLALLWLQEARYAEAEEQLLRCVRAASAAGMSVLDSGARSGLLCCAAAARDRAAWRAHLTAIGAQTRGELDRETAALILRAAELARDAGDVSEAQEAIALVDRLTGKAGHATTT